MFVFYHWLSVGIAMVNGEPFKENNKFKDKEENYNLKAKTEHH